MAFSHPYTGIRHDSILYLGDALARIYPGRYDQDLYFLFGSQGRYTLLPAIYAATIETFGVGAGTIIGLVSTLAAYLIAVWVLIASFAPLRMRFYCALAVILGWSLYGGFRIFAFAEPFLTARSFAEPAVLFALAFLYGGRYRAALGSLLIGAIFHPLLSAGAFLTFWYFQLQLDRRYLFLLPIGVVGLASCGWLGFGPFSDVFQVYDATWLSLAKDSNPQAFILEWATTDYGVVIYDCALLILAARHASDSRLRRLVLACLFAAVTATFCSFLLVDLGHSVFFGKLQIWRTMWIAQWIAMATMPLTVTALWKTGEHGRIASLFLLIGWMAPFSLVPGPVGLMALGVDLWRNRFTISRSLTCILTVVTGLVAIVVIWQQVSRPLVSTNLSIQLLQSRASQALAANLVLVTIIGTLWTFAVRSNRLAQSCLCVLMFLALAMWDQRPAWTRMLEARPVGTYIWSGLIGANEKVYWYHELLAPWILLGHANYYTTQQGSGAVFSRDMVEELERRRKLIELLEFQEQLCRVVNSLNEKATSCEPDAAIVRDVCAEAQVDDVVLQNRLDGVVPAADFSTGVTENGYEKKFFLYRCSALKPG